MKKILTVLLFLSASLVVRAQCTAVYGPWIQNVTEDSFTVLFKTDCKSLCRVELALDDDTAWYQGVHPEFYDTVSGRRVTSDFHAIKVTGLKPGTRYQYRVIAKRVTDDSNPYGVCYGFEKVLSHKTVKTLDHSSYTCRFSMVNDIHNNVEKYCNLMAGMDREKTDFIVLCGDIISYAPNADSVMKYTFSPIADIAASYPIIYARGNHEGRGPEWYNIPKLFPSPTGEFYFAFRQGPVAFFVLDIGEDKPDSDPEYSGQAAYDQYRAEELEWLKKVTKEPLFASAPHKVCIIHIPTLNSPESWYSQRWGALNFTPVLNEAGVELMLSGHHHRYIKAEPGEYNNNFTIIANDNASRLDFEATASKMTVRIYNEEGKLTDTTVIGSDNQPSASPTVEEMMKKMTVREKVAQLFVVAVNRNNSDETKARQDSLVKMGAGSLILMKGSAQEFIERTNQLQGYAQIPLLVAVDGEWGAGMRFSEYLSYPHQYELGQLDDAEPLIYNMGVNVGTELKDLNVLINLAPVADISAENISNGVRNDSRLFSSNPDKVARYAAAYMKGMQDAGIFACGKHFPGKSGAAGDSHKLLPIYETTRAHLDSVDLYPYKELFKQGLSLVMMGHSSVTCVDEPGIPLSISRRAVTGLLKEEMGFEGIVMTDALQMKAVADHFTAVEGNLMAYRAGVDMLLMPNDIFGTIDALTDSLEQGVYPMEELDAKVRKVLTLKEKAGYFEPGFSPLVTDVPKKIKAAHKRDEKLIRKMTRELIRCGYGRPIKDYGDPTLVLDKPGK